MNEEDRGKLLLKIDTNVNSLLQWRSALDVRCRGHRDLTDEVRTTIYGNPGKVDGLQFTVSHLINSKETSTKRKQFWAFVLRSVIIAFIVSLILGAKTLLTLYLKG